MVAQLLLKRQIQKTLSTFCHFKSHMLFTYKNFMFADCTWKKIFAPENGGGWCPTRAPFLYGPVLSYWSMNLCQGLRWSWGPGHMHVRGCPQDFCMNITKRIFLHLRLAA